MLEESMKKYLTSVNKPSIGETTGGAGGARHPLEFECIAVRYGAMNDEWMN